MIAALTKLRTWTEWGRTRIAACWQVRGLWVTGSNWIRRHLGSVTGRALTISLVLHIVLAVSAALSIFEVRHGWHADLELTGWAEDDSDRSDLPLQILITEATIDPPVGGGSTGSPLIPLVAEPNIADPVGNAPASVVLFDPNIAGNLAAVVGKPAHIAGRGIGRGKGRGIGDGVGNGIGIGLGTGKQFFGMGAEGKRFVYVLDCSLSMNHPHDSDAKTRFNRMKLELINSVSHLKPDQEFFIVFFNHEAIPMPANGPVSAIFENQRQYLSWMQQVRAVGDTDPTAALQIALRMRPDVLYFLTDGVFSPEANKIICSIQQTQAVIHTLSFEPQLSEKQQAGLELMRQKKMSAARLKLGESTYRQTREIFTAEQVMQDLAANNRGQYQIIP